MFRNDQQLGQVCFILCAWIPSSPWAWDGDGYRRKHFNEPTGISSGEAAMLRFAADVWGGDDLKVYRGLDGRRLRDIGELIVALGSGTSAIDAWIDKRTPSRLVATSISRGAWEADVRLRARS